MKKQQGFTMIELLVSMVLGLSLIAGVCDMFFRFQQTSKSQRALSYMMEDGRYVLETMSKELRSVGYLRNAIAVKNRTTAVNGAGYLRNENNLNLSTGIEYCDSRADVTCPVFLEDPSPNCTSTTSCTGVLGSTGSSTVNGTTYNGINFNAPVVSSIAGTFMEAIKGINGDATKLDYRASDSFAVRYQLNDSNDLKATTNTTGTELSNSPCTVNIHLTMNTGTGGNGLLNENPAAESLNPPTTTLGAQINVVTLYFYVANDTGKDINGNNITIPTLYCRAKRENQFAGNSSVTPNNAITTTIYNAMNPGVSSTPTAQPLISNIYRLVVKYGVEEDRNSTTGLPNNTPSDKTDDILYYTDASGVSDWTKVVSTKLYIVLRSEDDNVAQQAPTYKIEGVSCSSVTPLPTGAFPCPTDKRFYRVFSTTIAFRN